MAEMREGDWECPDCGALCFASRETCFKCDKKANGGGAPERRDGDWDCPDCGQLIFASKETCFKCDRAAQGGGDWICPACAASVFASKNACFKCNEPKPGAAAGGAGGAGGKAAGGKGGKAAGGKAAGGKGGKGAAVALGDAIKSLTKASPGLKQAWELYCDLYGEGWQDASQHEKSFLMEFAEYAGGLLQADLSKGGEEAAEEPAAKPQKRAAGVAPAAAPPEKKKVTVKKSVATKISQLNASGGLLQQIRLGAVAGTLCQLEEDSQLEALALLEEQAADIEDPNDYLRSQAQVMLSAAAEDEF